MTFEFCWTQLAKVFKSIYPVSPQSALRTIEVSLLSKVKFEEKHAITMLTNTDPTFCPDLLPIPLRIYNFPKQLGPVDRRWCIIGVVPGQFKHSISPVLSKTTFSWRIKGNNTLLLFFWVKSCVFHHHQFQSKLSSHCPGKSGEVRSQIFHRNYG